MRSAASRVTSNVDRLLRKERVLYDSRFFYSQRLWVICDEHFEQVFNPRTKQWSAIAIKQVFDVTFESYQQPLRKPSEVYPWLNWYDDLWIDGVATLTRAQLDSFLFHLENAEQAAAKAKQGSLGMGQEIPESSERETGEEDEYTLLNTEVF